MPYVKPLKPVGVNPALDEDRMPVVKVVNGDTWKVDSEAWVPSTMEPASFENSVLEFTLAENRFTEPIWTGFWYSGIVPDDVVPGLVHVTVPKEITESLRRGVYAFSLRVTANVGGARETELAGHFQVEYEPTSPEHNIPYRGN